MTSSNGNIFRVTGLSVGNSPVPVNSPHKGLWRGALVFSLICVWIDGWVNNREAGDLRRHRGHYDVTDTFWLNMPRRYIAMRWKWIWCSPTWRMIYISLISSIIPPEVLTMCHAVHLPMSTVIYWNSYVALKDQREKSADVSHLYTIMGVMHRQISNIRRTIMGN